MGSIDGRDTARDFLSSSELALVKSTDGLACARRTFAVRTAARTIARLKGTCCRDVYFNAATVYLELMICVLLKDLLE